MAPIHRVILTFALAAIVAARPLNAPRSPAPAEVTETAWTTINVPVTLWVDENGTPLSTVAEGGNFATVPASSPPATVTSTTTPAPVPESPKASVESPSPLPTTTTPPVVQKQAETTTPAPVASSPAPAPSSPAPAASPAAASGGDTNVVSASASNSCEGTGAACAGDITHWDGGLGACGWNVNTASDMQIALPVGLMGSQSNGNPYCGRSVTIKNPTTGQTVQATVGDKCMGCTGRSIDLTNALFSSVGGGCDGRCFNFEWWFN